MIGDVQTAQLTQRSDEHACAAPTNATFAFAWISLSQKSQLFGHFRFIVIIAIYRNFYTKSKDTTHKNYSRVEFLESNEKIQCETKMK